MNLLNDMTLTHQLIPGGAHTYSKGDDQFPANAPRYLERGEGVTVWDRDGNSYIDWTMGLRTMTLGYGRKEVDNAAIAQIQKGTNFGRPSYLETEFAEELVDVIPCAEMVKFAKNGSTITTAALKLARAYTGRNYIAYCNDHPFYSYDDWFIGTTPANAGIPEAHYSYSLPFRYNDIESLRAQFAAHPDEIAAVIMEPCTDQQPADNFLQRVAALCRDEGAVFVLDEMITGFRWHLGGAQAHFDVTPDIATFGKGMANGHSVSAMVGRRDILELGGLHHNHQRVFLISTTHGAENHGLAAARATLAIYRDEPVVAELWDVGKQLMDRLNDVARDVGVAEQFKVYGYPCSPYFACYDACGQISLPFRTLFVQEMTSRGVLMNYIVPSYAHKKADIDVTLEAAQEALGVYARALSEGWERHLIGSPMKPIFRPRN